MGGLRALATAALYLVLKSNGLCHSKNLPVKFGFSPIDTPANIAKKLPPQRCFKPLFIAFFNFSHKRPTFALTPESGYTLAFANRIAHKGSHGETGGVSDGGWYHYPRSVPHVSETLRGRVSERQTLPLLGLGRGCSRRIQKAFGTAMRLCVSLSRRRRGPAGLRCPVAAARSARFSGIERLDQAFRQSYYHTQQPNGQLFGTCVGTALGGKMRAITLGFKESYHGWTLPYKRTDPRVFHGTFRAERSQATVEKYLRSVRGFSLFLDGRPVTKSVILEWKGFLRRRGYAPSTVNASLAALNYLFNFLGWSDCRTHYLKIQRRLFRETGRELDRADYRPLSSLFMFISSLQHKDIPRS